MTDLEDLAAAATEDGALVSFALRGDHGCEYDGCYAEHEVFAFSIDRTGTPTAPKSPPNAAAGISPSTDAVPFTLGTDLVLLTQGHAASMPMVKPGQDAPDTLYVIHDGAIIRRSAQQFFGRFAAHGLGSMAVAIGAGLEWSAYRKGDWGPPSVRAFRITRDHDPVGELLVKAAARAEPTNEEYDAPAVAMSPTRAAFAFRHRVYPSASRELLVGLLDPQTAKVVVPARPIAKGDVGAPALLIDDAGLHIVWSERDAAGGPYRLRHLVWAAGSPAPEAVAALLPSTNNSRAPALARVGDGVAVAWMDADNDRRGSIYAGFGRSLPEAVAAAVRRSASDVNNARDPEWAAAGERALLVWAEHDGPRRVRFAWCGP